MLIRMSTRARGVEQLGSAAAVDAPVSRREHLEKTVKEMASMADFFLEPDAPGKDV